MRLLSIPDQVDDVEVEHLARVVRRAARLLKLQGDDVDAAILRTHAVALLAGKEWPGDPVRSTTICGHKTPGGVPCSLIPGHSRTHWSRLG